LLFGRRTASALDQDGWINSVTGVTGVQLIAFFGAKKEIWITHNCAWDECGNR
jgi:hypothetical protein